jgi:hypothetical protein
MGDKDLEAWRLEADKRWDTVFQKLDTLSKDVGDLKIAMAAHLENNKAMIRDLTDVRHEVYGDVRTLSVRSICQSNSDKIEELRTDMYGTDEDKGIKSKVETLTTIVTWLTRAIAFVGSSIGGLIIVFKDDIGKLIQVLRNAK